MYHDVVSECYWNDSQINTAQCLDRITMVLDGQVVVMMIIGRRVWDINPLAPNPMTYRVIVHNGLGITNDGGADYL